MQSSLSKVQNTSAKKNGRMLFWRMLVWCTCVCLCVEWEWEMRWRLFFSFNSSWYPPTLLPRLPSRLLFHSLSQLNSGCFDLWIVVVLCRKATIPRPRLTSSGINVTKTPAPLPLWIACFRSMIITRVRSQLHVFYQLAHLANNKCSHQVPEKILLDLSCVFT